MKSKPQVKIEAALGFPQNLLMGWRTRLALEKDQSYFQLLLAYLQSEIDARTAVYPRLDRALNALESVDFDEVRVMILGQDPYHGEGQALGLSFAVPNELRIKPPSLMNIFKEIQSDLNVKLDPKLSDLSGWVEQGVLLLNTVLTVRAGEAYSHRGRGWEIFTDRIISELGERRKPMVFILWGAAAQKKKFLLKNPAHLILESVHPSPLSSHRGFFGSKPFSRANAWLVAQGLEPIDWTKTSSGLLRKA